ADVGAVVRTFEARLNRELAAEVGRTTVPLEARRARLRTEETNLGDFLTDAMRARLEADVALMNGGGIRSDRILPAGPLTKRDVLGVLPFTNLVMKGAASGAPPRGARGQGRGRAGREGGGFPPTPGVRP